MKSKIIAKGFTLIELMIVIAIIGILAAIAIPSYQDYIARAQLTEAISLITGLQTPVVEYTWDAALCPDNESAAVGGIPKSTDIKGKYVDSVTVVNGMGDVEAGQLSCRIVAKMKSTGLDSRIAKKSITMSGWIGGATVNSGGDISISAKETVSWTCTSDIPQKLLPSICDPDSSNE